MTHLAEVLLSSLVAAGFGDLLSVLVRVTLIAAMGTFLCYRLGKASAAKRHLAAMVTLAALIALPAAQAFLPAVEVPILPAAPLSAPLHTRAVPTAPVERRTDVLLSAPRDVGSVEEAALPARESSARRPSEYVILTSLLVSSALLLHVLLSFMAAATAAKRARRIDDAELQQELESACRRLGVSRTVTIRESSSVTVPAVWGFVRPVLLLPVEARGWSRERLRVVFLHEVAHVARHDGIGLLLARVATAVFWFHPLVWKLAHVARQECERCCDDLVLAAGERATDYAAHLLAIVRSTPRQRVFADVAPALAQGSNLERRLASILRPGERRDSVSRARFVATIGLASLVLAATTVVQVVAAPDADNEIWSQVKKANREARQHAREVEAAIEAASGADLRASDPTDKGPCAEPCSPSTPSTPSAPSVTSIAGVMGSAWPQASMVPEVPVVPEVSMVHEVSVVPEVSVTVPNVSVVVSPTISFSGHSRKSYDSNQSGIELMRDGQYSRAITAFQEEIRQTGSTNAMYNLACAYALKGDKKLAFDALQKSIESGFSNTHHMGEDEDLRSLQGDPHFYELVRLAQDLQLFSSGHFGGMDDEKDWSRLLPRLERVTREHPSIGRAWANLGLARLEAGDPKGGVLAYQKALDLGYEKPTTLYNLACCASRSGDLDGAFKYLDRADQAGFEIGEYVGSDSDMDALRGDPRYGAMLKRWDEKMAKEHRDKQSTEAKQKTD